MNNKMRYAIIMVIAVLMNEVFYKLAEVFHIPVWLDVCGTVFAAFVLEPTAGLLVGLVNNFYLATTTYGASTLVYYSISAMVALVTGCYLVRNGKCDKKRILPAILLVAVLSAVISTLLAIWRTSGMPDIGWERTMYELLFGIGMPHLVASFVGTLVIKLLDTIASAALVALFYRFLPSCLKYPPAGGIRQVD